MPMSPTPDASARAMSGLLRSSTSMLREKRRKRARQMLGRSRRVGQDVDVPPHAAGIGRSLAAHLGHLMQHQPGMLEQPLARRRQLHAEALPLQQRDAEPLFQLPDPRAGGGKRQSSAAGSAGDVASRGGLALA